MVLLPCETLASFVSNVAILAYRYFFPLSLHLLLIMILQKNKYVLWAEYVSKTGFHLQEKENKVHLKHPEILLPTVTHSELQGRLPALFPGKMEPKKTSLTFSCRRHSRNLLMLLRQGSLPREGLQAGETTKGWGH